MKITLTYVERVEKVSAKTNKPYTSLTIKCNEKGQNFIKGFGNKENANWKVGDEVEIAEIKEVQSNGKTYLNFEMPKAPKASQSAIDLSQVLTKLGKIELMLKQIYDNQPKLTSAGTKIPDFSEVDENKSLDELAEQEFNRI